MKLVNHPLNLLKSNLHLIFGQSLNGDVFNKTPGYSFDATNPYYSLQNPSLQNFPAIRFITFKSNYYL